MLIAAGMLSVQNRNYDSDNARSVAAASSAPVQVFACNAAASVAMQNSSLELHSGDQTAHGDTGLELSGTQTGLKLYC